MRNKHLSTPHLRSRRTIGSALAALAAAASLTAAPLAQAGGPNTTPPGKPVTATVHTPPGKSTTTTLVPGNRLETGAGVVQSVTVKAVVLKQLDGSRVIVPIDRYTRVFVNGRLARLADVKPGFVVVVAHWIAGEPANVLRFVRPG